ncbi:helix-turn-helix transcriptional regulator [Mesorhizobium sp. LCM 4577]|uniref:helix-turn-helix transcriptional regulator n=1 Tax=Mesorhizobium sp. LCM 4577 TaxID=1848288 RepID=UPI000ACB0AF3|nr:helix-turn-helix transcriptional regulator [Mesorhizobium sp. LCM 4577]
MTKTSQSIGATSATDIAKLLAQAGPSQELTKLLMEINASGDAFKNVTRDPSRPKDTIKLALNATEIAKAISQIPPTQALAKQSADVNASSEALKAVSKEYSRQDEAIRSSLDTRGISEALTSVNALADVSKRLTDAMPQVNLQLPDVSEFITTALPRTLPDAYLPRSSGSSDEDEGAGAASPRHGETDTLGLEIVSASDLGRLVRRAREGRHLSQQSFADLAGVGRRFLSELENGKATLELGKVLKVAHAAGISLLARER